LAELLDEGLADESDRPSVHNALRTEAARLSNTVTSLLETARFFRGSDVKARRELVPVSALIERASGFPGVVVELTRLLPTELVDVDVVLLHLAIDNLLENAARHAPEGRPWVLTLELDTDRDELVLHVRDHGPGLPPGPAERLFDAFYRGDDRLTSARGSGLGLALVAHAARAHGGSASATRPLGGGALFTARFPFPRAATSKGGRDDVEHRPT
jgi:two-component system sensor histidine kinase KdpD